MSNTAGSAAHNNSMQQTQELIAELEDMALDPTLDQCCRRDIQSQIAKERIRQSLQHQDRIDTRQRLAAAAVCRDATALACSLQDTAEHSAEGQCESSVAVGAVAIEDAELAELRRQRLAQLQAQSVIKQDAQRTGFGCLNDVQEGKLMVRGFGSCLSTMGVLWVAKSQALLLTPPGRGLLVVHLAVQGHEPCNTLDECLQAAAVHYRGTYFARVVVSRRTPLVGCLQLPQGVPALLVCREGSVLGKAHISQFGAHDIWEEEVMAYLRRFKVLSSGEPSQQQWPSSARPDGAADDSDVGSDEDSGGSQTDDWATPCEVCGRTYAHTHVRALYSTQQQDGSEEEED